MVRTLADAELAAGKVKAFFDRVKVRDLYDISNLKGVYETLEPGEQERAHRLALYYASLSACFPKPFANRAQRFSDRLSELADQLYPMLRSSIEHPTLEALMEDAERFIAEWVLPRTDGEREYLGRLAGSDYRPELILPDKSMAKAAPPSIPRRSGNSRTSGRYPDRTTCPIPKAQGSRLGQPPRREDRRGGAVAL